MSNRPDSPRPLIDPNALDWPSWPTIAPAPDFSLVINITCAFKGLVEITRPTIPSGVTTGMLTSTPAQRPLSIVILSNHIEGSLSITRAATVLKPELVLKPWRFLMLSAHASFGAEDTC